MVIGADIKSYLGGNSTIQLVLSFLINPMHYQVIRNKAHTVRNPVHIVCRPFTNGLPSKHGLPSQQQEI